MADGVIARVPKDIKQDIEFFAKREHTDKSTIIRDLLSLAVKQKRLEYALLGYQKGEVSLGKASEMAKLPLAEFMAHAASRKIPLNYSKEELRRDFGTLVG